MAAVMAERRSSAGDQNSSSPTVPAAGSRPTNGRRSGVCHNPTLVIDQLREMDPSLNARIEVSPPLVATTTATPTATATTTTESCASSIVTTATASPLQQNFLSARDLHSPSSTLRAPGTGRRFSAVHRSPAVDPVIHLGSSPGAIPTFLQVPGSPNLGALWRSLAVDVSDAASTAPVLQSPFMDMPERAATMQRLELAIDGSGTRPRARSTLDAESLLLHVSHSRTKSQPHSSAESDLSPERIEKWLDEHQEFAHDYYSRKPIPRRQTEPNSMTNTTGTPTPSIQRASCGSDSGTPARRLSFAELERLGTPRPLLSTTSDGSVTFVTNKPIVINRDHSSTNLSDSLRSGRSASIINDDTLFLSELTCACEHDLCCLTQRIVERVVQQVSAERAALLLLQQDPVTSAPVLVRRAFYVSTTSSDRLFRNDTASDSGVGVGGGRRSSGDLLASVVLNAIAEEPLGPHQQHQSTWLSSPEKTAENDSTAELGQGVVGYVSRTLEPLALVAPTRVRAISSL